MQNDYTAAGDPGIVVFGRPLCGDTVRSRELLESVGVAYTYRDKIADPDAGDEARAISGRDNTPVISLPDGTVLVEPTNEELLAALENAGVARN